MMRLSKRDDKGFTMIELMVVIAVIGILSVIAILQFSKYRQSSFDSAVETDMRNAATAQEAYFSEQQAYCNAIGVLTASDYGLAISDGVNLQVASTTANGYTIIAYHSSGNTTFTLAGPGGSIQP